MRKWLITGLAALALFYSGAKPFETFDTSKLCVVETLLIEQTEEGVRLCGEGIQGVGATVKEAVANMEASAPGQLFLRQVKRILFCGGAEKTLDLTKLPEEISYGTICYRSGSSTKTLCEDLEVLEARLDAREKRDEQLPTLAKRLNQMIKRGDAENSPKVEDAGA